MMKKRWLWVGIILVTIVIVAGSIVYQHKRSSKQNDNGSSQLISSPDKNGNCPAGYSNEASRYPVERIDPENCYKIEEYPCEKQPHGCPICLAASTLIDTNKGLIPITKLMLGDMVWSINNGKKELVPVEKTGRMKAPSGFNIKNIKLADGRLFTASPTHPTSDARRIGDLRVGDKLDGSKVVSISSVNYSNQYTYDLLPESSTGYYWANGVLLGSTLK